MQTVLNRLLARLASPALLFYTLPWLMVIVIVGTLAQPAMGLHRSVETYFNSWIFWFNFIPLPGAIPTLGVLTLNLTARFLFRSEWVWRKSGIHLTHLGVLILLFGGLGTALFAREAYMIIPEGKSSNEIYSYVNGEIHITPPGADGRMNWGKIEEKLPFTITLSDFVRTDYPGTDTPQSYYSDIRVDANGQAFPVRIGMNRPLRYAGYTFFQSSFIDVGDKQATVFQVTHNTAGLFPYIATLIIAAGLLLHLVIMRKRVT